VTERETSTGDAPRDDLFREEAVRSYTEARVRGRLLRISPAWSSWAFWVLIATVIGAIVFASVVRIDGRSLLEAILPEIRR
jgi:membrane fusion protein (multidrug efflux system)